MKPNVLSQLKTLLAAAPTLRAQLSNTERLQLSGLAEALRNELERPDEAVFRVTFNEVRLISHGGLFRVCRVVATAFGRLALTMNGCIQPGHYLAIRLALQWGVFEALGDVGEKGVSCEQIAEGAGADARLVGMYALSQTVSNALKIDMRNYLEGLKIFVS